MAVKTTVQVVMPQMGDSVTEGTILEWHKQAGDAVAADETIVEISTDKVDMELPAPASGTLTEILAQEGDTVHPKQVLGRMTTSPAAGPSDATALPSAPEAETAEPPDIADLPDGGKASPVARR